MKTGSHVGQSWCHYLNRCQLSKIKDSLSTECFASVISVFISEFYIRPPNAPESDTIKAKTNGSPLETMASFVNTEIKRLKQSLIIFLFFLRKASGAIPDMSFQLPFTQKDWD